MFKKERFWRKAQILLFFDDAVLSKTIKSIYNHTYFAKNNWLGDFWKMKDIKVEFDSEHRRQEIIVKTRFLVCYMFGFTFS